MGLRLTPFQTDVVPMLFGVGPAWLSPRVAGVLLLVGVIAVAARERVVEWLQAHSDVAAAAVAGGLLGWLFHAQILGVAGLLAGLWSVIQGLLGVIPV